MLSLNFNTIRFKLIFGLFVIMLPIITFLVYNSYYSISVVRNQVAQSSNNLLHLYTGLIDKDLNNIDTYLLQFAAQNAGLSYLERPAEQDQDTYNLAQYQLFRELYEKSNSYNALDFFFAYSVVNQDLILAPRSTVSESPDLYEFKNTLKEIAQDSQKLSHYSMNRWTTITINGTPYLIHLFKFGNVYIGALVNSKEVMVPLDLLDLGENGRSLIVDAGNQPLMDIDFYNAQKIQLNYERGTYLLTGTNQKYLVIGEQSSKGDFSLLAVIPDRNIIEQLPYTQRIILIITIGAVFVLIGALYFLRRTVLLPINRIIVAMRKIKDGNLEARIVNTPISQEFRMMNETFNDMMVQIQELKINVYEERLNNQKAELKHLQLQVNPHFYLNSLNIVYYLAEDQNYPLLKELSLSLIGYFRFMFRSHMDFVLLKDEIQHVQNYLRIQEFRFPENLTTHFFIAESLMNYKIPPLIVQTFIENVIKHAVSLDEPIHIRIDIEQNVDQLIIRIEDTGKGFEPGVLQKLEQGIALMNNDSGEHIGIWNVQRRIWLLYQDQANITFYNNPGAAVKIVLPLQLE
ncbi:HAMP domain-containing protein [Paenibacillus sp. LMG 31461]|uniref:HAMP domain-containing protein n=1 Tax=Paenibacillus plantarum TaxID=2654975 RepID=A0ABX1X372_9BACL|nr:histidine kinase [Paenibacillus plantarum]NOU62691.1 HAMP domain-containing protein [Paenibacillus plantarum]